MIQEEETGEVKEESWVSKLLGWVSLSRVVAWEALILVGYRLKRGKFYILDDKGVHELHGRLDEDFSWEHFYLHKWMSTKLERHELKDEFSKV